jgi:CHAT domain-containing protein
VLQDKIHVKDMLSLKTEVALVTFSTCLSGAGRCTNLRDVQGFAHDVLAAGANAYIGAL